jgi:hypothetical protein
VLAGPILLADFKSELEDMVAWLVDCQRNESDDGCRHIARLCLMSLKEVVGDPFEGAVASVATAMASSAAGSKPEIRFLA